MNVRVSNNSKGWVAKGAFPVSTYIGQKTVEDEEGHLTAQNVAVHSNIRREAKAGFVAAEHWARFRTMALAAAPYLTQVLSDEQKRRCKGDYNDRELMRSRIELAFPLMVSLLPNTSSTGKSTSLKQFYHPGILEAETALGVEWLVKPAHGVAKGEYPAHHIKGYPIKIVGTPGKEEGFDAHITLGISTYLPQDDFMVKTAEGMLKKYLDVRLDNTDHYNLRVTLHIPEAHKVLAAIREGTKETELHRQLENLGEILHYTHDSMQAWYSGEEASAQAAAASILLSRKRAHLKGLEQRLSLV